MKDNEKYILNFVRGVLVGAAIGVGLVGPSLPGEKQQKPNPSMPQNDLPTATEKMEVPIYYSTLDQGIPKLIDSGNKAKVTITTSTK